MDIKIKYNDELDEFTWDLTLNMRIERYIREHFYPAYTISILAPVYLVGGGVRDLVNAKKPKDLDFVVLGNNKDFILDVFKSYNIVPSYNKFQGYKFDYHDTTIDLWLAEDLFSAIQYNVDGLLFDLKSNIIISLTFDDFQKRGIRLVNPLNNINNNREEKLKVFAKTFSNKSKT